MDDYCVQIGSANIDPRSLRLNFELAVEIYYQSTAALLTSHVFENIKRSREITIEEIDARPLTIRTRDAIVWLFSPYPWPEAFMKIDDIGNWLFLCTAIQNSQLLWLI